MGENDDNKKHTYSHNEKSTRRLSHNWGGSWGGSSGLKFIFPEIINWQFKKYLISCETLQIDPTQIYEPEFIYHRAELVLKQFEKNFEVPHIRVMKQKQLSLEIQAERNANIKAMNDVKELLTWFIESYRAESKFLTIYALKCKKLINKNRLQLLDGTVNIEYQKRWLRQDNYDFYIIKSEQHYSKIALIVCLIVWAMVAIGGLIATIIINNL